MTQLQEILAHNARYAGPGAGDKVPRRRIAVVTCMDTRLVAMLEEAMGLGRGDANVIKTAGNAAAAADEVVRSLVVAVFALGCGEVFVVGHRDCGLAAVDGDDLRRRMLARGIAAEAVDRLRPALAEWVGAFADPADNVVALVEAIRRSPLLPADLPVHGLIVDPDSGRLELLTAAEG